MPDRSSPFEKLGARRSRCECDVVVRAGVHAVEAEGAVQVSDLHRQEESQLAASLFESPRCVVSRFRRIWPTEPTLDAVRRLARPARVAVDDAQLGR